MLTIDQYAELKERELQGLKIELDVILTDLEEDSNPFSNTPEKIARVRKILSELF